MSFQTSLNFLKQVSLHSEAYLKGDDWVRSRLADLKIDLWLATEHGEVEEAHQVEWIHQQIEVYQSALRKTLFDPDPKDISGSLAMEAAAADLASYVLQIVKQQEETEASFQGVLTGAKAYLRGDSVRNEAHSCMTRVHSYCGIIFEDVGEVIQRAQHLLDCCK